MKGWRQSGRFGGVLAPTDGPDALRGRGSPNVMSWVRSWMYRRSETGSQMSTKFKVVGPVAAVMMTVITILSGSSTARAHAGDQSYVYLDITENAISGRLETPIGDLNETLGLDIGGTDEEIIAQVDDSLDEIHAYLDAHLEIGSGATTWPIEFAGAEMFDSDLPEADEDYLLFFFTADVGTVEVPRSLDVTFDPFFDDIPGRDGLLLIGNDWQGGVIENAHEVLTAFDAGTRTQTIDLGNASSWNTFSSSIQLGVNHIRTGPDHILFVLVLLLPSVLVLSTSWKPTKSFRSSLWRVLKIVTMFTVAHSITFTLAGLDLLPLPPSQVIETIIALSIAAAALHNIKPLAANKEWLISFAFGLFHGMGFASLVEDLDVSRGTQLMSLLGRNVGIEFGQSIVVLAVFPALFLLRRTKYYRPFFLAFSATLIAISLAWAAERAFSVDLKVNRIVEPLIQWPRVILLVGLLTIAAGMLFGSERRAGRLLDVHEGDENDAEMPSFDPPVHVSV
jgi:HupE / UreJ protein